MRSRSSRFVHREKRPIAPIHLPPEAPPRVPRPTRQSSSPAAPPRRDRSRPAMPYSGVAYAYGPPSPPAHRGKGAALRAGFDRAMELDPSYLVTMDADGQHDPADLERLVWPVMVGECALATGSRFLADPSRGPTPLNRYLVRKALIAVLRATLGRTYTDPCCGYRCFSSQALQGIQLEGDHYQSELEALFEATIHGLRVVEVPVRGAYPPGWSKMGAPFGRLAGRAWVITQYVSTIARKTRELRRARAMARPSAGTSALSRTGWGDA